jgi:dolichyl-phosphate-mannose--protein O-mannosyl transferase
MKRSLLAAAALLTASPALAADKGANDAFNGLFWLAVIFVVNFLPVIIANVRKHNSRVAIVVVLVLLDVIFVPTATLGLLALLTWPFIALAWFGILIWSFSGNTETKDQERAIMIAQAMRAGQEQRQEPRY